jgi:hypothetical protein
MNTLDHLLDRLSRICEFVYIFVKEPSIKDFSDNKIIKSISDTGQKYLKYQLLVKIKGLDTL